MPAIGSGPGSLVTMRRGGRSYAVPAAALPYLGHGLDPSLFDVRAVARAEGETTGRLPVSIRYQGRRPAPLPGITITSAGPGSAEGYLTGVSAKRFGRALDKQFAVDHADAGYGTDGLFADGLTISLRGRASLATAPGAGRPGGRGRPAPRPQYQMRTLTVTGSYRDGRPDTGDLALLVNVDNAGRLDVLDSEAAFYHGTAKVSVPAGHYFAMGVFFGRPKASAIFMPIRGLTVLPQFTVAGNTRIHLAEPAASRRITMTTQRPAHVTDTEFEIFRKPRIGQTQSFGVLNFRWVGDNVPMGVSPTSKRPSIGTMATVTDQWLASPGGAAPYEYDLAYQNLSGLIPRQHYVVRDASLATISARYYLSRAGSFLSRDSSFPIEYGFLAFTYDPVNGPGTRTIYSSAAPGLLWTTSLYTADRGFRAALVQSDPARIYRPGQHVTENWNTYPLHPAPNVHLIGSRGDTDGFATVPSASRAGNTLTLDFSPFGDNTPGHAGAGFNTDDGRKVTGSYEIDQNGKKIVGGNALTAAGDNSDLNVLATLSPARSTIKFSLTAALGGIGARTPSSRSQTTWTWSSAHQSGNQMPIGWSCPFGSSGCRPEPLVTLGYSIRDLSLRGQTRPGPQVLAVTASHLPPAKAAKAGTAGKVGTAGTAAKITKATVQVSFDGGRIWHHAKLTGTDGRFLATYAAPAGAWVTLRTHAQDAAGATITETITRAYRVAPRRATGRAGAGTAAHAACPVAGPGRLRCYALYSQQTEVNEASAAGTRAAPKGWGAPDIESAYKLPVSDDPHQTVAVVDAYRTPKLAASLAAYRSQYGLPACTASTGCLRIVNQSGAAAPLPVSGVPSGWDVETALDVEMVSAACPLCKILVVEARSNSLAALATAENTAARLGAQVISDSFGGPESGQDQTYARAFHHPGHVIVVASGDLGFTVANFPADQSDVTAVGGTEPAKAANQRGWTEQAWQDFDGATGSGCSAYIPKLSWQHDQHCTMRTVADVSAVADNLAVNDQARKGWLLVEGTSAAAPLIAGVYAVAGNATTISPSFEYHHTSSLFDVTTGNNDFLNITNGATCGHDYLCEAGEGYDAPTGLGTPNGTGDF
ncbi:MAG TPA: S8 family serine peptidase [Streptosporangiaceae bacterium]